MGQKLNAEQEQLKIDEFNAKIAGNTRPYLVDDTHENTDEYVQFRFLGVNEGMNVVIDAAIYTLRLHHESELYGIAEERAAKQFPNFKNTGFTDLDAADEEAVDPQEEEVGLFMAEVILELEEEETVKVKEHIDMEVSTELGVSLDIGLHVDKVTPLTIERFIREFNSDTLKLDDTLYTFQTSDENE